MKKSKNIYKEKFPVVTAIFIGILILVLMFRLFTGSDLSLSTVFAYLLMFFLLALLVVHVWLSRFCKPSIVFYFFPYNIIFAISKFKQLKPLVITYLSMFVILIIILLIFSSVSMS